MQFVQECTIKLIKYLLTSEVPVLPDNIDFAALRGFGVMHGIENMLYAAISELNISVPPEVRAEFEEDCDIAVANEAIQQLELELITEAFEREKVENVPLKGSVLKFLYPMPDYRKSGDIDILIHNEDEERVIEIMKSLDYEMDEFSREHIYERSFSKQPNIRIEIHCGLVGEKDRARRFCAAVWQNVELNEGCEYTYHMNNEYLFVYLVAHLCKHLYHGGAGIRLITDLWVVRDKLALDKASVDKYLEQANLLKIGGLALRLADKWFEDKEDNDEELKLLEMICLESGTFGNSEIRDKMKSNNTAEERKKNFLSKIFMTKTEIKYRIKKFRYKNYPYIYMWLYWAFYNIIFRRGLMKRRLDEARGKYTEGDVMENLVMAVRDE